MTVFFFASFLDIFRLADRVSEEEVAFGVRLFPIQCLQRSANESNIRLILKGF